MTDYKHVGNHAEDLADGRMIGPGEQVTLDEEALGDPHNQRLIEEGILLALDEQAAPDATDSAIELAKSNEINLTAVTGTGLGGRITKEDVERHLAETSENSDQEGR